MLYTLGALQSEYASLWRAMVPDASRDGAFLGACRKMQAGMVAYRKVEAVTGVPAAVIAVIHIREANGDFATHLHNGDPLNQRTYHVPAGRPTIGDPPFTWEESATDALRFQGLTGLQWTIEQAAFRLEGYNGFGYRNRGLRSPYLWGGTNQQEPGKYVADGKFDPATVDRQLGCMPLLAKLWSLDPSLALSLAGSPAQEPPPVRPPIPDAPPVIVPMPRPRPPQAPSPATQGALAAIIAALLGGTVAFRDQVLAFIHSIFN